jgi:uncharacterized membrane protein YfbV (UPF0208 family)
MTDKQAVFNWQIVTVILALLVQFGGVVWIASRVTFQVERLSHDFASLKQEFKEEKTRLAPLDTGYMYIERDIKEIKADIAEIKKRVK